ncbi:SdpI family protein [Microbacterium azadirachtae]|uniref:SdpI/YhfL protein family protein n=1 Tax=Microbacterium azadirachtae TaxID=582680 RepID=A0A0F0LPW4_9MICO|nr:SdpI family protein [Microbacterium azadirachtae]KJL34305.1 hypothetical protein RS86_01092 [Microbacterium azadirachtae]
MTTAIAILFLALAALSVITIALAAAGSLGRNRFIGIRTAATLSSDDAWKRAHRAGLLPAGVGAFICALLAVIAIVLVQTHGSEPLAEVTVGCSIAAILVGGVWSTIRASRHATP